MESKKRKTEKSCKISDFQNKKEKRITKEKVVANDIDNVCTVTLHWSKKNSAYLLKCIYNQIKLLNSSDVDDDCFWHDIEKDMKEKFPWVFIAICQEKWKGMMEETEKYMTDHNSSHSKPEFFYIVREIIRIINDLENSGGIKSDEDDDDGSVLRGFAVADPDAVKLEPFAGVVDSVGNMYLHEPLFEIVRSLETLPGCADEVIAGKHGVEEAIVEWVRENQESILRGSLQCSTCNKSILKRDNFISHELECFLTTHQSKRDDGGLEISYDQNNDVIEEPWTAELISLLIKIFKEKSPSYVASDGLLTRGIWMEIFKVLKPMEAKITPILCHEKWTDLVNSAREYSDAFKERGEDSVTLLRPRFFTDISDIVDLDNVEIGSFQCYIPKELIPEIQGDIITPRVFLSNENDHSDNESDNELEVNNDNDSLLWSDEENLDTRPSKKSRLYFEHKLNSLSIRLKMLEEENMALRRQQADVDKSVIPGLLNRLDKFCEQQLEAQAKVTGMMKDMADMFERHHDECLETIRSLGGEVFKYANSGRRKIS